MRTFGSFLSAIVGWLSFNVAGLVRYFFVPGGHNTDWGEPLITACSAVVIFLVWLAVLRPLYVNVPADSLLWRWPVCTLCGVACATLLYRVLLFLIATPTSQSEALLASLYVGSLVGGTTCLFGSLTAQFFRAARRA